MAIIGYVKPGFRDGSFTCPHCNCFSQQEWRYISRTNGMEQDARWVTSWCLRCQNYCLWQAQRLVWPVKSGLPDPVEGCPKQIEELYDEARQVFPYSPRYSAALLRLAIQIICKEKGLPGRDLNADIGSLVGKGLAAEIQQSLDLVRVVGNHAVHPGQIVIEDNKDYIERFFGLVNLIVEVLIVQPARISSMFNALVPQPQKNQIAARDAKP